MRLTPRFFAVLTGDTMTILVIHQGRKFGKPPPLGGADDAVYDRLQSLSEKRSSAERGEHYAIE